MVMAEKKAKVEALKVDTKEFELPETLYVRDIDNRVFQGIILQTLSKIQGISPIEGGFIGHILGQSNTAKGITAEQDPKTQSISATIEVRVAYGVSIPEKAEEIQTKVARELSSMTGLHVSSVHVVFKELISQDSTPKKQTPSAPYSGDYSDVF
jgi:uncharacterized alkaline shock family protein YloU